MSVRREVAALIAALIFMVFAGTAQTATFKWASDGDIGAMDPYTRNETVQLSFLANIYEPLVRRDQDMRLEPALATSWEQTSPTVWRFHLRPGVKWQDGSDFSALDVIFSLGERIQKPTSRMHSAAGMIVKVTEVDLLTVDIMTNQPDPLVPGELTDLLIMSRNWCQQNGAQAPVYIDNRQRNYADDHAMGTGPFRLLSRQPGSRTIVARNETWWGHPVPMLDRAELDIIADPKERVAALLAGKVDMIYAVPTESIAELEHTQGIRLLKTPELRTIFLGMDEYHEELDGSDVTGRNPFKDRRVREAFALAIDETAIAGDVMHGLARPAWLLWGPGVSGYDAMLDARPAPDLDKARQDMTAAGYPQGFSVRMDCPDNRYLNDSQICKTIVGMLARIGVRATLHLEDKGEFFRHVGPPYYRASFFLLGWTPSTDDAHDVLRQITETRHQANWNSSGYSNATLDSLIARIGAAPDSPERDKDINDAARILQADLPYIPLHQQEIVWAVRSDLSIIQTPNNYLALRYVGIGTQPAASR
jgi:peptide/nickel transport system substrate-binding protein